MYLCSRLVLNQAKNNRIEVFSGAKQEIFDREYVEINIKAAALRYSRESRWAFLKSISDSLEKTLKPIRILDIGCAKGFLVYLFDEKGIEA